ncbi:MAG TPA: Ig-like domain-containing protein [Bacteroidota bacterium]|nr:Ig-like domain-containing protein [Bacteroidota bacterium]
MKRPTILLVLFFAFMNVASAQRADLSGLKFCIDPGHGGHSDANDRHVIPDPGTNFYESESNFQIAIRLKPLLEAKGATILLTRYTNDYPNDNDEPTLEARVALANANNVNWFHSIHSNATGDATNTTTNYTLMLIREKRPGGPYSSTGNGLGVPEMQESWDISLIIAPKIMAMLRTQRTMQYLDWTFYGGTNGGFSLGVLRGLSMPGELSEAAFHDYYPETRLLMNNSYLKMEAYAIRDAFLQYFGVPADTLCMVAGILSEPGTNKRIDGARVRVLPENIVYNGDLYHNGFYMLDSLRAGVHTVRFETPGYKADSIQVTLVAGKTSFNDRQIESTAFPVVITSYPSNNDSAYSAAGPFQFVFSKPMDTASVRTAIVMTPLAKGSLIWSNANTVLTLKPDSVVLPFNTWYTLRIEGNNAKSAGGLPLDGNGDGISGDDFVLTFKTKPVDVWPPVVLSASPATGSTAVPSTSVINFTFDEPLTASSVNSSNVVVQEVGTGNRQLTLQYSLVNGQGAINVYPQGGLKPGRTYKVRVSGLTDLYGNAIPTSTPLYTFTIAPLDFQASVVEDFSSSVGSWYQPATSGSTTGIDSASFSWDSSTSLSILPSTSKSGRLTYYWNTTTATDWLIREYLSGGPGRSITWNKKGARLQAYVYGDGSGTLFRFAVDDSVDVFPAGNIQNHEVNLWTPINWIGWKLVEWNFDTDSLGTWLGNGKLEGMLRFDSFQLKYAAGAKIKSGTIYVAQVQVVTGTLTGIQPIAGSIPLSFGLDQNYPNPFNPSTAISYQLSAASQVTLKVFDLLGREVATLVNGERQPGRYSVTWDASGLSSGVYLCRLQAGNLVQTRKMVLMK